MIWINKGKRYARLWERLRYWWPAFGVSEFYVTWIPNETNHYTAANKKQADRWQKLGGYGAFLHHNTSMRLVYRSLPDGGYEYAAYKYQDGKRSYKVLGTCIDGERVMARLTSPKKLNIGMKLLPYFELVPTDAPHSMRFDVTIEKI